MAKSWVVGDLGSIWEKCVKTQKKFTNFFLDKLQKKQGETNCSATAGMDSG